ncbi:long-chain-fatty-acid--CoA ligase 1 isoform X1 [Strongylocentrotus purpuratus]|uniref:Long-chain-fatty-acid--CoA ligase n=2 Tax=Strongylocentrotus purpuratus TaxID=7668 RepID=A0A7M7NE11_STRPU|nr:long-chain-fatty-acid--CoA ligase 1 isoform X1 [Strongylocentrotus purpuratus]
MLDVYDILRQPAVYGTLGVFVVATFLDLLRRRKERFLMASPVDLKHQSIELPGEERVHVSALTPDRNFIEYMHEDARTVYQAFLRGKAVNGDADCMGSCTDKGSVDWISYNEVYESAKEIGSGLIHLGLKPKSEALIGIYAQNRLEWGLFEVGCITYSLVNVPLYDTLGPDVCSYIINQGDISIVVCDTTKRISAVLEKASSSPSLKIIIGMLPKEITPEIKQEAQDANVQIFTLQELRELGKKHMQDPSPPEKDDMYTVCYTSGTTGNPKGAMLTHANIIAAGAGLQKACYPALTFIPDQCHISYLPLAHMYERLNVLMMLMHGGKIAFYRGDVKVIIDDVKMARPSGFCSVPRLLNRVHDKVMQGVNGTNWIKKTIFNMGMKSKMADLEKGICRNNTIWDKLAFKKIQAVLGGNLEVVFSGAAPLSPEVISFLRCVLGVPVLEGYGQTESAVISTLTLPGDHTTGQVGPPLPCCEIKLIDVPEMEYYAKENKGEICFRGANVFKGYLNNPEKTKEALDDEEWLHSGDIGMWLPNGTLKIIDRRKNIFKLAQGEYLAPEKIETVYSSCSLVQQIWIYGDSLQSYAVAIGAVNPETLPALASKMGVKGSLEELCKNEQIKKGVLDDLMKIGKEAGLKAFEQAKYIHLYPGTFEIDNGLMTPTQKLKRVDLRKFFVKELKEMYPDTM